MKFVVRSSLVAVVSIIVAVILCSFFSDAQAKDPRMGYATDYGIIVGGEPGEDPHYRTEPVKVPYCDSPPLELGECVGTRDDDPYTRELLKCESGKFEVTHSRRDMHWLYVLRVVFGNVIR
jgi:hypothetical protein